MTDISELKKEIAWHEEENSRLRAEVQWHEEENNRLRAALHKIADGDVPRQHAVIWRRDGELSKHDKCPHYQVMYEGCEECVALFARAALEGKK